MFQERWKIKKYSCNIPCKIIKSIGNSPNQQEQNTLNLWQILPTHNHFKLTPYIILNFLECLSNSGNKNLELKIIYFRKIEHKEIIVF